jgi:hypothetical protein
MTISPERQSKDIHMVRIANIGFGGRGETLTDDRRHGRNLF